MRAFFDFGTSQASILAVHEGMLPLLLRGGLPKRSIQVLRNPVVPWTNSRVQAEKNHEIFFVGRLETDKGIMVLAQAARESGAALRVIGTGPLDGTLRARYPEVDFLGQQPQEAISRLIVTARTLVVPTLWRETFGLVALESLMSGVPIIISLAPLIAHEIIERGLGFGINPGDKSSLKQVLEQVMYDDQRVLNMSELAFRTARGLAPSPEAWGEQLVALYKAKHLAAREEREA
jgi:glycosyltransferase involved in cell wall biosynthesis